MKQIASIAQVRRVLATDVSCVFHMLAVHIFLWLQCWQLHTD